MTTLGREGSDYTAGLLGNLMNADKVVLWKDVPGVMDKNPNLPGNEDAKKIDTISYDDFIKSLETTATGLVHPKTLNEVKEKGIPLQVRPFWDLTSEGTMICYIIPPQTIEILNRKNKINEPSNKAQ
jgi:aspartate kinase